jgi:hypothetical protein
MVEAEEEVEDDETDRPESKITSQRGQKYCSVINDRPGRE